MKKVQKGFTLVELLVVIGILGILMGALFPAISSAMLSAQTSAMATNGDKLFKAIVTGSIDRNNMGLPNLWPHKVEADGLGTDTTDIGGMAFTSATDYFVELFDMKHYGSDDREAWVDCDLSVIGGAGVPAVVSGNLQAQNVAWAVLAGKTDQLRDFVPVLVSRNADTSNFPVSGSNTMSTNKEKITFDAKYATPFGNKAFVIVRNGGGAEAIKSKNAKFNLVYKNESFSVESGLSMEYLRP